IVGGMCVPNQMRDHNPSPCVEVNLQEGAAHGFAVLKDLRGASQFLLIPTVKIAGIESPELLAPDATNYFDKAWAARSYGSPASPRTSPPEDTTLALNSAVSRSQDSLHIHIDCVRIDVHDCLHSVQEAIGEQWRPLPRPPLDHPYKALWVAGEH